MTKKAQPDDSLKRFMALFHGFENGHGEHGPFAPDETGKMKGPAVTKIGGAGEREYQSHLAGKISLGLIPLLQDNTCWFGEIDIDVPQLKQKKETPEIVEARVRKLELPLVVCRSKSGGAHLCLFGSSPLPAKLMVAKLTEFSALLGYGGCEIFPKQTMRVDTKDVGNWINIAYYGASNGTGTDRYAIRNGKPIPKLADFLKYAEDMRVSSAELEAVQVKMVDTFSDGPRCLQHLVTFGISEGGRNMTLANVAVYLKKKHPGDWEDRLAGFNQEHVTPPLPQLEVDGIRKNLKKKDYVYGCKNSPLCLHCDKEVCKTREFGITAMASGETGELFPITNLTRCVAKDSVTWYVEHQGLRLRLTTDQLVSPKELQKVFMERFAVVILFGKVRGWMERLKELMLTCDVVQNPEDASREGQFENMLDNYFAASRPARNKDELIKGNVYAEDGRLYFRSETLFAYLTVRRFQHKPPEIWDWLETMGATHDKFKIRGKTVRVWSIPEPERFDLSAPVTLPEDVEEAL